MIMEKTQIGTTTSNKIGRLRPKMKTKNKKSRTLTKLSEQNSEINQPLASPLQLDNSLNNSSAPDEHNATPKEHEQFENGLKYHSYKETGIKSKKIKYLVHPLDHLERNILIAFVLAIVFTFIALVSGLPTILLLVILSIPILSVQHFIYFCANLICRSKIYHKCELFDFLLGKNNINNKDQNSVNNEGLDSNKNEQPLHTNTTNSDNNSSDRNNLKNDWKYCPLDYLESYWFKPHLINQCVLFTEQGLTLDELRKIIHEQILLEPEFKKFKSRVVARRFLFSSLFWECLPINECRNFEHRLKNEENHKEPKETTLRVDATTPMDHCIPENTSVGLPAHTYIVRTPSQHNIPACSNPSKIYVNSPSTSSESSFASRFSTSISIDNITDIENINKFSIDDHIIQDEPIKSKKSLRKRNAHLLNVPLKLDKPLWQIRLAVATYINQCVIIVRCHQSLADGSRLIAILVKCGLLKMDKDANATIDLTKTDSDPVIPKEHNADYEETNVMSSNQEKSRKRFVNSASNTMNVFRACIVGPLTCFLWIIWAFSRRHYNHLNPTSSAHHKTTDDSMDTFKRFYMASYDYAKLLRIKQATRSTLSEVILCALCGAAREYLRRECYVDRPPNLNIGLTVDMRGQIALENDQQNIRYVLVNVPLPIAVEGAIPRLWETRHIMEELRSSADPWVMLGFQYFLSILLPQSWYVSLINFIVHRNSSICVSSINQENIKMTASTVRSNNNSCDLPKLTIGTKNITKIYYCLQPPTKRIPISFNCISYNDSLFVSCSSKSIQIDDAKMLVDLFFKQLNQLSSTIAKRRIHDTTKLITQSATPDLPELHSRYQFRSQSVNISALSGVCCPLHHDHFEDRQSDHFKVMDFPMANLTSSISADYIDKYSRLIGSCICDNCQEQNLHLKSMATSAASFLTTKPRSFTHDQYCEIHNRHPSCQFGRNSRATLVGSTISLQGETTSTSTAKATRDRSNISSFIADVNRRSKQHTRNMTSSLSQLEDLASQGNVISVSPTPTTVSRATNNSEGPVELVKRQFNQLVGDIKRRRSLAAITEHHGLQHVVVEGEENDELVEENTQLRYPTNRRFSALGLAVGPGRRASLVPFNSITHPGIPKSHSGSNETQV